MSNFEPLAVAIVKEQEKIVGPLAWSEAAKVSGISVKGSELLISGEGKTVLEHLVHQYEKLFGQASVEACKDAVRPLIPKVGSSELPKILL